MLKDKLPHERLALIGLAALAVGASAYAIAKGQHRPAPIVFQNLASQPVTLPASPPKSSDPTPQTAESVLVVDATGAVKTPGVLHMAVGSRVDDAVKAAGGATSDADLEAINLAAKLVDGTQVFVPRKSKPGEAAQVEESYRGGNVAEAYAPRHSTEPRNSSGGSHRDKKEPPSHPISLSTASAEELESVPGIGPATAQKILDYRQAHGGFASLDELLAVKGIGPKKLDAMRKYLRP